MVPLPAEPVPEPGAPVPSLRFVAVSGLVESPLTMLLSDVPCLLLLLQAVITKHAHVPIIKIAFLIKICVVLIDYLLN
jgi:hypothetical protein